MERKAVSGIMLTLVLLGVSTLAFNIQTVKAAPTTWTVDDDGGADFTKIQDAIDAASPGDTIFVYNGTYYENLVVDKGNLRIVGENKSNTIIDGGGHLYACITIWTDNVSVNGFTVRNGGWYWVWMYGSAIYLAYVQSCNISDNIVFNSRYGITSVEGGSNTIRDNTISDTNQGISLGYSYNETVIGNTISNGIQYGGDPPYGIQVWDGDYNTVVGNIVTNISYTGIRLTYATGNVVTGNIVSNTSVGISASHEASSNTIIENNVSKNEVGIEVWNSNYNTITLNEISNNNNGIWHDSSLGTTIHNNNITNNNWNGIQLYWSSNYNTISGNNITNNDGGISLYESSNNAISGNNIANNWYGISLYESSNNAISGNNIENNNWYGISLYESSNNTISGSNIANNWYGITLSGLSENNTIDENIITNNLYGIDLFDSFNNRLSGNNITTNTYSNVYIYSSSNNTLYGNNIANSQNGVMLLYSSNNNIYHNNFINNIEQVYSYDSVNVWDDGYPSGGNYWSNHVKVDLYSGEHQDQLGGDGIVDIPYVIDGSNRDNYPLMSPWTPAITAAVDVDPDALNLKSRGQWITAYIELPNGYNASYINVFTILLNDTVPAVTDPKYDFVTNSTEYLTDHDGDGVLERMVKFNKTMVIEYITDFLGIKHGNVILTITGQVAGTSFQGSCIIKVLFPGDVDDDGGVDRYDFSLLAAAYGTSVDNPAYVLFADFNEDQNIDRYDFSILAEYYGKTAV